MKPWKLFIKAVPAFLTEVAPAVEGEHGSGSGESDVTDGLGTAGILDYAVVRTTNRTDTLSR